MLEYIDEKTELQPGDKLCFNKISGTIFFQRDGIKIYFLISEKDNGDLYRSDKKLAGFISDKKTFCQFAVFMGNLFCLGGEFCEETDSTLSWDFTYEKKGTKNICHHNTEAIFDIEIQLIRFQTPDNKLRPQFLVPFIFDEKDLDNLLIIISTIFNCVIHKGDDIAPGLIFKRIFSC